MTTVGQKLYEERTKKGYTLEQISKAIKIRPSFLLAIEKGEYHKLPSSAYAYGFIKNYLEFLNLPKKEMMALFRREFDDQKMMKILPEGLSKESQFPGKIIKLQELSIGFILLFILIISYIAFQYRYAIINPPLEVYFPEENSAISVREIDISGKSDVNSSVTVNSIPISLNEDGIFKKTIDLLPGKKTIVIKSVNRFGKETVIERHVEVIE